jgi:hypothetical protein
MKHKNTTLSKQIPNPTDKSIHPYTQIYDRSLSWLGTGASIKGGGLS